MSYWQLGVAVTLKMFFLLTPFFALSMFLVIAGEMTPVERRRFALRTTLAVAVVTLAIYWFGRFLFTAFGITVDAFRVGAGIVLMLTAIGLVNGNNKTNRQSEGETDQSVVPMAVPNIVGPGTIGALLVMGADQTMPERFVTMAGVLVAVALVGTILYAADALERILKRKGIQILSKITGLMLAALAAQIIFTGIKGLLKG